MVWQEPDLRAGQCAQLSGLRVAAQLEGGAAVSVSTELEIKPLGRGYAMRAVVSLPSTAGSVVQVEGLSVSGGVGDVAAASVQLAPTDKPLRQLANGYSIFNYAGVVSLPAQIPAGIDQPRGMNLDAEEIQVGTSWWWMGLRREDATAPTLLVGALDADLWPAFMAVQGGAESPQLHVRAGFTGDPALLRPGQSLAGPWLWVAVARDWQAMLGEYAELVAMANSVPQLPAAPAVWSSWHSDFDDIDEDIIAMRLDALAAADYDLIELAQIDDGWQRRWGDWTHAEAFPSGMTALAEAMSSRGYTPGLWVAPALIDEESDTALAHPDWLLRNAEGETIRCVFCSTPDRDFGPIAVLDLSLPQVQGFVRGIFEQLVAEGFRMFKIDFTLMAADPSGISSDGTTGMQRYRALMQAIAAGTVLPGGGRAYRSVIGSPFLAPAGYAEATRFGPDLAYALVSEELPWESVKAQARNYAGRWFMANRAFTADLDAAYQRPDVPLEDVRSSVAVMSLAAGFYHIGDRVTGLDEERRATLFNPQLRELMATMSPAVPMDLWTSGGSAVGLTPGVAIFRGFESTEGYPPAVWRARRTQGEVWYFFNWSDEELSIEPGQYLSGRYTELWSGQGAEFRGFDTLRLPPHAVRVYWK